MEELLTAFDVADPATRTEDDMARAEFAARMLAKDTAELWATIDRVLRDAREQPELWAPVNPRDSLFNLREFAERAAVTDLAVRLHLAEDTVRSYGYLARSMRTRLPRCWQVFRDGEMSASAARAISDAVLDLDDAAAGRVDAAIAERAKTLPVARVREVARRLADRERAEPKAERHKLATERRGVWIESAADGMAWLSLLLPEVTARRALAHLDAAATHLGAGKDENRTRDQLRADIAADLLTGAGTPWAVGVDVAVTVPMMTLLGESEEPGCLDGRIPIDADTARQLAGGSAQMTRILTHPITGTVMDVDRNRYRPPTDLDRWVKARDKSCRFPGCGRPARRCDLDHTTDWGSGHGGKTSAQNLAALCRTHHTIKHKTHWSVTGDDGRLTWTSPTGHRTDSDPPPF